MISSPGGQVHTSDNLFADHRPLPVRAERQEIIERARLMLTAARAITAQSDRWFALPSTERPAERAQAATAYLLQRRAQPLFAEIKS